MATSARTVSVTPSASINTISVDVEICFRAGGGRDGGREERAERVQDEDREEEM